jgi:ATP-dependent Clp protease ATP-binding subunit ClpC
VSVGVAIEPPPADDRVTVFEKFTDRARRVIVLAQEEARTLNHNYIGTEHLLLGLIHEGEGVAAKALENLGIALEVVRGEVEAIIGQGMAAPDGNIPFTPRAKKALELSLRESKKLQHDHIGTEHILLGLIREDEGVAAQVLARLGAGEGRVRQEVLRLLDEQSADEVEAAASPLDSDAAAQTTSVPSPAAEAAAEPGGLGEVVALLHDIVERLDRIEQRLDQRDSA